MLYMAFPEPRSTRFSTAQTEMGFDPLDLDRRLRYVLAQQAQHERAWPQRSMPQEHTSVYGPPKGLKTAYHGAQNYASTNQASHVDSSARYRGQHNTSYWTRSIQPGHMSKSTEVGKGASNHVSPNQQDGGHGLPDFAELQLECFNYAPIMMHEIDLDLHENARPNARPMHADSSCDSGSSDFDSGKGQIEPRIKSRFKERFVLFLLRKDSRSNAARKKDDAWKTESWVPRDEPDKAVDAGRGQKMRLFTLFKR